MREKNPFIVLSFQTTVAAMEIPGHPFYLGVQYHPEFKSRPNRAHPIFREFVKAALEVKEKNS